MRFFNNVISVAHSFFRLRLIRLWRNVSIKKIERLSPNVEVYIGKKASLILGNRVRIHRNSRLVTDMEGKLEIGDDTAINQNCGIYCFDSIKIGSGCVIGPNVLKYDHDHEFKSRKVQANEFTTDKVTIGNNVWIGGNVIILKRN